MPLIGDGGLPQYLLHEQTLAEAIRRAVRGDFDHAARSITVAQPEPVTFRELLSHVARQEGRDIHAVPVPWRLLYIGLRLAEALGLNLNFRSDSVLSFVFQNTAPDFEFMDRDGLDPIRLNFPA